MSFQLIFRIDLLQGRGDFRAETVDLGEPRELLLELAIDSWRDCSAIDVIDLVSQQIDTLRGFPGMLDEVIQRAASRTPVTDGLPHRGKSSGSTPNASTISR